MQIIKQFQDQQVLIGKNCSKIRILTLKVKDITKRSLENFHWKTTFSNCNPNEHVSVLTKAVLNIIPNETILVDDRDPRWITRK